MLLLLFLCARLDGRLRWAAENICRCNYFMWENVVQWRCDCDKTGRLDVTSTGQQRYHTHIITRLQKRQRSACAMSAYCTCALRSRALAWAVWVESKISAGGGWVLCPWPRKTLSNRHALTRLGLHVLRASFSLRSVSPSMGVIMECHIHVDGRSARTLIRAWYKIQQQHLLDKRKSTQITIPEQKW